MDKHKKVGEAMENGYIVLVTDGAKCLAFKASKKEFATWIFDKMHGSTAWGHYFTDINNAILDYNERSGL